MKKIALFVCAMVIVSTLAGCALAGGGQNCETHRGDKGSGEVNQNQNQINQ